MVLVPPNKTVHAVVRVGGAACLVFEVTGLEGFHLGGARLVAAPHAARRLLGKPCATVQAVCNACQMLFGTTRLVSAETLEIYSDKSRRWAMPTGAAAGAAAAGAASGAGRRWVRRGVVLVVVALADVLLRGTGGVEWGEHTKSGKRTARARGARDGRVQSARLQAADGAR